MNVGLQYFVITKKKKKMVWDEKRSDGGYDDDDGRESKSKMVKGTIKAATATATTGEMVDVFCPSCPFSLRLKLCV